MLFPNRTAAGEMLADELFEQGYDDPAIVAIPNGGVMTALPVAKRLGLPLQLCVVAKIPFLKDQRFGIGAVDANGTVALNEDLIRVFDLVIDDEIEQAKHIARNRYQALKDFTFLTPIVNKTVIIVDDCLATGYTALTAVRCLERFQPKRIVIAAPISGSAAISLLESIGIEIVVLDKKTTPNFIADNCYGDFPELSHSEIRKVLTELK